DSIVVLGNLAAPPRRAAARHLVERHRPRPARMAGHPDGYTGQPAVCLQRAIALSRRSGLRPGRLPRRADPGPDRLCGVERPLLRNPDAVSFRTMAADRKSTRLNSSHDQISYAVFCLKKKKMTNRDSMISLAIPEAPSSIVYWPCVPLSIIACVFSAFLFYVCVVHDATPLCHLIFRMV